MKRLFGILILFTLVSFSAFSEEYSDSSNKLRLMTFEDEVFIPEERNTQTVIINKADSKAVREYYDEYQRLVKKETWLISDAKKSKPVTIELFSYGKTSGRILSKKTISEESEESVTYGENGLPSSSEFVKFSETAKENQAPEKVPYLVYSKAWKYDKKDRLIYENHVSYKYADENYSKYSERKLKEKKLKYHEDEEIPPDSELYENGKLTSSVTYESKGTYINSLVFDSGYTVKSYFVNDRRVKDEYFQNGNLLRSKEYE